MTPVSLHLSSVFVCQLVCWFILNPLGGNCVTFDEVMTECEDVSSTANLCLTTLAGTGFISLYRKGITKVDKTGIIAKISPMSTGDLAEVTMVGGSASELQFIAFGISDRAKGAMGAGGPALICMIHRGDYNAKMFFTGTLSGGFAIVELDDPNFANGPNGGKKVDDFFRDGDVEENVDNTVGSSKVIVCKFKITNKMWKLDSTELDLKGKQYNVAFAQGKIYDLEHQSGDINTLLPQSHDPMNRFVSTAKYFLHGSSSAQVHILDYLTCGITDYCVGAGLDGCGSASFDCKFLIKFVRQSDTTLSVVFRTTTFKSFIGVGFSSSPNILDSNNLGRLNNLKFLVICDTAKPSTPSVIRVECPQKDDKDATPCKPADSSTSVPVVQSPITIEYNPDEMNSRDEKVGSIICKFDLVFSGDDLEMMKLPGTRVLIGGNDDAADWFQLLKFPINPKFAFFPISENAALLKEGETALPPRDAWEIAKQEHGNQPDPSDLNFSQLGSSTRLIGKFYITGLTVVIFGIFYC